MAFFYIRFLLSYFCCCRTRLSILWNIQNRLSNISLISANSFIQEFLLSQCAAFTTPDNRSWLRDSLNYQFFFIQILKWESIKRKLILIHSNFISLVHRSLGCIWLSGRFLIYINIKISSKNYSFSSSSLKAHMKASTWIKSISK